MRSPAFMPGELMAIPQIPRKLLEPYVEPTRRAYMRDGSVLRVKLSLISSFVRGRARLHIVLCAWKAIPGNGVW